MAKAKRPQVKPGELVVLSSIKRPIPAHDGKPFVGRESVLRVSSVTGTGTARNPWHVVVTDGQHSWNLEGDDVVLADPDAASKLTATQLEREIMAMTRLHFTVEYAGTPDRVGACYGSSLVRGEAEAAVARAAARGLTTLAVHERTTRPDVAGWLPPCDERGHVRKRR